MGFSLYIKDSSLTTIYDFPCDSANLLYDQFLSIDEPSESYLSVFPNPTESSIFIEFKVKGETHQLRIISLDGRLIHQLTTTESMIQINLGNQPNGAYLVHWSNKSASGTLKIIKR